MKRKQPSRTTSPGPAALAPENLPYQMFLLVQQMTKRFQKVLTPHGVTPLHWGILCCLWREDGLRTTEIATRLEQLGGTVTVGLDVMEREGLVRRKKDKKDGRISRIFLTAKGRGLQKVLEPAAAGLIREMFAMFPAQELHGFADQVARLRESVGSSLDSQPAGV